MSLHGSAVFYRPDPTSDPEYYERMKRFNKPRSSKKESDAEFNRRMESAKQTEHDKVSMFFVDHVIENEKKQDVMLTASIIDALCYRIKKQLSGTKEIVLISENAKNDNKDQLPLLVTKIIESHGMTIESFLHPDACCDKSCVDAHFSVAWRLIKRYTEETESDVITSEDIVDGLIYDDGVKNSVVDFSKINRNNRTLIEHDIASNMETMAPLGAPTEIKYQKIEYGKYKIFVYKYSGGQYDVSDINGSGCFYDPGYVHSKAVDKEVLSAEEEFIVDKDGKLRSRYRYVAVSEIMKRNRRTNFKEHMCKWDNENKESELERSSGCEEYRTIGSTGELSKTEGATAAELSKTEGATSADYVTVQEYMEIESRNELNRACDGDNLAAEIEDEDEMDIALNGVINMTSDVMSERRNRQRRSYQTLKPRHTCTATGVEIKFMSPIHFYRRNVNISTKKAFADAETELECPDEEQHEGNEESFEETERGEQLTDNRRNDEAGTLSGQSCPEKEDSGPTEKT